MHQNRQTIIDPLIWTCGACVRILLPKKNKKLDVSSKGPWSRVSTSWRRAFARNVEFLPIFQEPVVQSWISANPGLKFNLLFCYVYFCMPVCFKTSQRRKLALIQTIFLKKYFQIYKQPVGKFALNFRLTYRVKPTGFRITTGPW
jgi:hypothetical protein